MCGLCGVLGGGAHWADGLGTAPSGSASATVPDPLARRRARRQHVAIAGAVLRRHGLTLSDWHGTGFVLRGRTGATRMVTTLDELWAEADRLGTAPIDPLDPELLAALGG